MEHTVFEVTRRHVGVQRLYQNGKEIVLNGEHEVAHEGVLEVRNEQGEVVASMSAKDFHALLAEEEYADTHPSFPDHLLTGPDEEVPDWVSYHLFGDGHGDMFLVSPPSDHAFFKALNVPTFCFSEGEYRDSYDMTPFHPELITQWRDLQHIQAFQRDIERLQEEVRRRSGAPVTGTKRPRTE
jgi:hypothetical protein